MLRLFTLYGKLMARWAQVQSRTKFLLTLLLGLALGLVALGWWLWPVQWTNGAPVDLQQSYRDTYLRSVASAYSHGALTLQDLAQLVVGDKWSVDGMLAEVTRLAADPRGVDYKQLVDALNLLKTQKAGAAAAPPSSGGQVVSLSGSLLPILGLLLAAVVVVVLGVQIARRAGRAPARPAREQVIEAVARPADWPGETDMPLREFNLTYVIGDDRFDMSNAIETASGAFLGECGLGIGDTIGTPDPSKVTAFEVWLFDKNDIRTVTTVLMSEHAFKDAALKAKLAAKGDAVLGRPGEIITLETASLRVRAKVTEIEYGTGALPERSFFNRLRVVMAAWPIGDSGTTQPGEALRPN